MIVMMWVCRCEGWYSNEEEFERLYFSKPSADVCHEWDCTWVTVKEVETP